MLAKPIPKDLISCPAVNCQSNRGNVRNNANLPPKHCSLPLTVVVVLLSFGAHGESFGVGKVNKVCSVQQQSGEKNEIIGGRCAKKSCGVVRKR